jgi:hypothetical protein
MSPKKILVVFGVSGSQGGFVIKTILEDRTLSSQFEIWGIARDPSKPSAAALAQKAVTLVKVTLLPLELIVNNSSHWFHTIRQTLMTSLHWLTPWKMLCCLRRGKLARSHERRARDPARRECRRCRKGKASVVLSRTHHLISTWAKRPAPSLEQSPSRVKEYEPSSPPKYL